LEVSSKEELESALKTFLAIKSPVDINFQPPGIEEYFVLKELNQLNNKPKLRIDDVLDNIKIDGYLGSGAFGTVYKGTWCGTPIAFKVVHDMELTSIFERDMYNLTGLQHAHIVQFFGTYFDHSHGKGIVSEFIANGNLKVYLTENGSELGVLDLVSMATDIARGMSFLASKNIVHGDLAARNCLVKMEDRKYVIKITDFGSSAIYSTRKSNQVRTGIQWSSPEVIESKVPSRKSDVWSYGMVLYEIFTYGKDPYPDLSNEEIKRQIRNVQLPTILNPNEIHQLMVRCCQKVPSNRLDFNEIQVILNKLADQLDAVPSEYVEEK